MVTITSLLDRISSVSAPIIPEFLDQHTNASIHGTAPANQVGASAVISMSQEEPAIMSELSHKEEMQVNRSLAQEFILQYLDIPANHSNIETLANCIFQLEHSTNLNKENQHGY